MKAVINGITIEGTPQEIAEYQKITEPKRESKISKMSITTDQLFGLLEGMDRGYMQIKYMELYNHAIDNRKSVSNHGVDTSK